MNNSGSAATPCTRVASDKPQCGPRHQHDQSVTADPELQIDTMCSYPN